MKASVKFFERINNENQLMKVESFKTKKLARQAIRNYLNVRIIERVSRGLQAKIYDFSSPYSL